jgi:hypothetical protein
MDDIHRHERMTSQDHERQAWQPWDWCVLLAGVVLLLASIFWGYTRLR